jgi:two-component system phosphate regulon sensor histidine kinase PhoR
MTNRSIKLIAILGAIVIASIVGYQTFWLTHAFNSESRNFHQSVEVALFNVAKAIVDYNGSSLPSSHNLIKQASSNYYVVNVNDVIDASLLEYFLKKELYSRSIKASFEYAIYDCASDEMKYGDFCLYDENSDPSNLKLGNLPKYDDFIYYFGVRFPGRTGYIFRGLSGAVALLAITLLAIIFYTYSLIILLKQKRLSEMQKDFINNMTHEFRTPISSIRIAADVIANHPNVRDNGRLARYTDIVKTQNERLSEQVQKVLQIAKLEKKDVFLQKERIDLHELIGEVLSQMQVKIRGKKGQILKRLMASDQQIMADPFHLSNVLFNLLDNAIKYSANKPEIEVATTDHDNQIELIVRDHGIGISKEHMQHIFKKFYRVPTGNLHNAKGFGLGLFYTKTICDAHGWKIDFKSGEQNGTEVSIWMKKVA